MRRALPIGIALVAALLVACQLILPGYLSGRVESRLTQNGGDATVSLSAIPAAELLFGQGDKLRVRGSDLTLDLTQEEKHPFQRLDEFGNVDMALRNTTAGPFSIHDLALTRNGSQPYHLRADSTLSLPELAAEGAGAAHAAPLVSGLIAGITSQALPASLDEVPVNLDMLVASDGGTIHIVSGGGTIAGYPTGPLAELITSAIAVRL
jgi:hypothetical protein